MAEQRKSSEPRDTSPLELDQLSDDELSVILEIEQRLREVRTSALDPPLTEAKPSHLPFVQVRHPRVLLLDGGRGAGKTSLLLTMAHAWTPGPGCHVQRISEAPGYDERVTVLRRDSAAISLDAAAPDFIQVIGRVLDFDPLPAAMPLIAGIVQAWRPLVDHYDTSPGPQDCEADDKSLSDRWHQLFRIAAVGWSPLPQGQGLVEQVLDREEQVENWHSLDAAWRQFIDHVIERGRCLKTTHKLSEKPVFVIMIDDVDLQVERISQLLPALRLLYHSNVVFLVAADQGHMKDMLKLDFLGQQNKLAGYRPGSGGSLDAAENDRYATRLAESTIEKVFQKRNRWKLDWLSLAEVLAFPHDGKRSNETFGDILEEIVRINDGNPLDETKEDRKILSVAAFLAKMAKAAGMLEFPGIITFRAAQQLYHYVKDPRKYRPDRAVDTPESVDRERRHALSVLAGILGGTDDGRVVSLPIYGELGAAFQPTLVVPGSRYNVLLSARPDFIFSEFTGAPPRRMLEDQRRPFSFLTALAAKALEELQFPVEAAGLRWENYLSLAWSEWKEPTYLSFAWDVFRHPRSDEILRWANDWRDVIQKAHLEFRDRYRFDRYMFAWIYYQRVWNDLAEPDRDSLLRVLTNREQREVDFSPLLDDEDKLKVRLREKLAPADRMSQEDEISREVKKWREVTLPLLARPELGISPPAQEQLLQYVNHNESQIVLRDLRRRKISDALYAAGLRENRAPEEADEQRVGEIVEGINKMYLDSFERKGNYWTLIVDGNGASQRKSVSTPSGPSAE